MSDCIKIGDKIHVKYNENYLCFDATVVWTPQGTGDTFQIETEDGKVRILNIYAVNLLWIERIA